jgi:VIT1/CCC1 family predicted Fe2+/Mn2+ transporter
MSFLEFSVSSDSVLMLTGMLAELKSDLNKELETHHMKGAMKQVVDKDDMEAVAEIRHLLEKAGEPEPEPGTRHGKRA